MIVIPPAGANTEAGRLRVIKAIEEFVFSWVLQLCSGVVPSFAVGTAGGAGPDEIRRTLSAATCPETGRLSNRKDARNRNVTR
jgi:hypothetical protein